MKEKVEYCNLGEVLATSGVLVEVVRWVRVESIGFANGLDIVWGKRVKYEYNFCDLRKYMNNGACLSLLRKYMNNGACPWLVGLL